MKLTRVVSNLLRDFERRARVLCLATVAASLLVSGWVSPLLAQTVTLPTVRAGGPGLEEALLFRLVREMRAEYGKDTLAKPIAAGTTAAALATDSSATRLLSRLHRLVLASVTGGELNALYSAKDKQDSLEILAGKQYIADDPIPQQRLAAIREIARIAADSAARSSSLCHGLDAVHVAEARNDFVKAIQNVSASDTARQSSIACGIRSTLDEEAPALLLGSPEFEARADGRLERAEKLDSLVRVATALVVQRKLHTHWGFPVRSRLEAEAFWRQKGLAPLNVGSISGSSKAGVTFTELASPLLERWRTSINAVLAAQKPASAASGASAARSRSDVTGSANKAAAASAATDTGSAAAIQRLLTGGGTFNVSFALPVTNWEWLHGDASTMTLFVPRFGLVAPVLGSVASDTASLNTDIGVELHARLVDFTDGVGVMGQLRLAEVVGQAPFMTSVGADGRRHLEYGSGSLAFLFGKQYLVTASRALFGPRAIRRAPWQIGMTVIRAPST